MILDHSPLGAVLATSSSFVDFSLEEYSLELRICGTAFVPFIFEVQSPELNMGGTVEE
jgi:hypothetical protein